MHINTAWGTGVIALFTATAAISSWCNLQCATAVGQREMLLSSGITLSARARETRQKLADCDCFPCFSIESSRNYFPNSFVRSSDWWIDRSTNIRSIANDRDTLFARSWRNVKTLTTIYDTGFWLFPLFYGTRVSFLYWDNRRMNGKWVKSVSEKIKSSKKLFDDSSALGDNRNDRKVRDLCGKFVFRLHL